MKKRKKGRTLSRSRSQRVALLRTMTTSLILHKRITTTLAKAKELRPYAERIASHAKKGLDGKNHINVIRLLKKDLHMKAIDEVIKMAKEFKDRKGGYLRIVRLAPRKSDSSVMAIVEWVDIEKEKKEKPVAAKKDQKTEKKKEKDADKKEKKEKDK